MKNARSMVHSIDTCLYIAWYPLLPSCVALYAHHDATPVVMSRKWILNLDLNNEQFTKVHLLRFCHRLPPLNWDQMSSLKPRPHFWPLLLIWCGSMSPLQVWEGFWDTFEPQSDKTPDITQGEKPQYLTKKAWQFIFPPNCARRASLISELTQK